MQINLHNTSSIMQINLHNSWIIKVTWLIMRIEWAIKPEI